MTDPQVVADIQATAQGALAGTLSVSAFTDFGTILRPSWVSNGMGGSIATFSAHGTAICSVLPLAPPTLEIAAQGRVESVSRWLVTFPAKTDVTEQDRIASLGNTYDVVSVMAPQTMETSRRCECVRAV